MSVLTYVRGNGRHARRVQVDSAKTSTIAILEGAGFKLEKSEAPAKAKPKQGKLADLKSESESK